MNDLFTVCLVSLTMITAIDAPVAAQSPVLRAGVSVELADASNSVPMPDADTSGLVSFGGYRQRPRVLRNHSDQPR